VSLSFRAFLVSAIVTLASVLVYTPGKADDEQPAITREGIQDVITADLAYNAPNVSIILDDAEPSPAIRNLERAGILRIVGKTGPGGYIPVPGRLILLLTEYGQSVALAKGWAIGSGKLEIATGQLEYIPGSYKLGQGKYGTTVSYSWRYEPNSNVSYLLKWGRPQSWPPSMYVSCLSPTGHTRTAGTRTMPVFRSGYGTWDVIETATGPFRGCSR
jgi:hypothetical protein